MPAETQDRSWWRGRAVLVTGGAGFIGSHLARRLVALGCRVRVADNLVRGTMENLAPIRDVIDVRTDDLTGREACERACDGVSVVLHLASRVGGIGYYLSKPAEVLQENVLIDAHMLRSAARAGVARYLYVSSAHVYPAHLQAAVDAAPIREDQVGPADPPLSYGWAKLLGEKQVEALLAEGAPLRAAILRVIGVYGPNQDLDLVTGSAIPAFIRRAIEYPAAGDFVIKGSGRETRSYHYIDDTMEAMMRSIEALEERRLVGPLNIGSEERIAIGDLAREIVKLSGKTVDVRPDLAHPTAIWGQVLDCSRAREQLGGWQPVVSLREGLERTYACVRQRLENGRTTS